MDYKNPNNGPAAPATPKPVTNSSSIKPLITNLFVEDKKLLVNATVTGTTTGTCTLILSKAGSPEITKTTQVEQVTSYYSCGSFVVPVSEFPASGNWSAKVRVTTNGITGESDSRSVEI